MASPIIKVDSLSKSFRLGSTRSLWERLLGKSLTADREPFWALKDVNFEVQEGEVLGVIGRNGAGKSTLLKVLTRIIEPSSGQCVINGRVGSLLEVGTGFHPELTGRDNIYLNGAILGMSHVDIKSHFDEIVDFAGVEKFIDTPVKRYSSGMYVRLAFAVAAFLKPEVLLIDEVLAVGDVEFQKKCLGKMENIASSGRTIIFVSHNMGMINTLCHKGLLLSNGQVSYYGQSSEATQRYFDSMVQVMSEQSGEVIGDQYAEHIKSELRNAQDEVILDADIGEEVQIVTRFRWKDAKLGQPTTQFHIFDDSGVAVLTSKLQLAADLRPGVYEARCVIPAHFLNNRVYFIGIATSFLTEGVHVSYHLESAIRLVIKEEMENTLYLTRGGYRGNMHGLVRPKLKVAHQQLDD